MRERLIAIYRERLAEPDFRAAGISSGKVTRLFRDATGVWIHELPATPERILAALDALDTDPSGGQPTTEAAR